MRGLVVVGGFAVGLLACSAASAFACSEDAECSLSGEPGVCAAGNCAYPSDSCESGYVFPDGAPGNLAGMCADVETGTGSSGDSSESTGPGSSTGSGGDMGGTTIALDDGTTADDTTTSTTDTTSMSSDGDTEVGESSSSGGCNSIDVYLEPIADAFMTDGCPEGPCELINHGATTQLPLGDTIDGQLSVMALRYDTQEVFGLMLSTVTSAELELSYENQDGVAGSLQVSTLDPMILWEEGQQSGSMAVKGESCWAWAQYQLADWPDSGPTGSIVAGLGETDLDNLDGAEPIVIPLDPMTLASQVLNGADSILVHGSVNGPFLEVFSRESGQPPRLHITGC